jgi:hypothetical protein
MTTNKYTQGLKQKYGVIMVAFPQLTHQQIDAIVAYIDESS